MSTGKLKLLSLLSLFTAIELKLKLKVLSLTFKLSEDDKMEICPLALENEKNEIDFSVVFYCFINILNIFNNFSYFEIMSKYFFLKFPCQKNYFSQNKNLFL